MNFAPAASFSSRIILRNSKPSCPGIVISKRMTSGFAPPRSASSASFAEKHGTTVKPSCENLRLYMSSKNLSSSTSNMVLPVWLVIKVLGIFLFRLDTFRFSFSFFFFPRLAFFRFCPSGLLFRFLFRRKQKRGERIHLRKRYLPCERLNCSILAHGKHPLLSGRSPYLRIDRIRKDDLLDVRRHFHHFEDRGATAQPRGT